MNRKQLTQAILDIFAERTQCAVQYRGCPCNTCFHAIKDVDFQHVCWLILLGLRGDYSWDIVDSIKEEVEKDDKNK